MKNDLNPPRKMEDLKGISRSDQARTYKRSVEKIRKAEYPLLEGPHALLLTSLHLTMNVSGITYLDHAGTTPYPRSLMKEFAKDMEANLFGNPHSQSPSSLLSAVRIESVRAQVLAFFKADPEHFDLVFVANATAAIKLVMDGFRGHDRTQGANPFWYGYHVDSHTSLVGVREAAAAGARCFASDTEVEDWLCGGMLSSLYPPGTPESPNIGLFAYPAQSNMNGRRLPLTWPGQLRASRYSQHQNVYSLLDAAAFVSTAQLDLTDWHSAPDFTALSFYKIFGYPDLGALLVRKTAGHVLSKSQYFGGGTVDMVINATSNPHEAWHARKGMTIHEAAEEGTPAFHSIIALDSAMKVHRALFGSMDQVSRHAGCLAKALYECMSSMKHANGTQVCKIYKDAASDYSDTKTQGPTIAFNVQTASGGWVPKTHFEQLAIMNNIQLRTGGVCNPGGIAHFLRWSPEELRQNFAEGLRCGNGLDVIDGKPTGIVRVSLGAMSSMNDIQTFIKFMHLFFEPTRPAVVETALPLHNVNAAFQRLTLRMGLKNTPASTLKSDYHDENIERRNRPVVASPTNFELEVELQQNFRAHQMVGFSDTSHSQLENRQSISQRQNTVARMSKRLRSLSCI